MKQRLPIFWLAFCLGCPALQFARADELARSFREPPDSARPGVYWYFMDGNLSREGMTRDLESMKAAGIGHVLFLEVNVGVPRGPVDFLSEQWRELFAHAVREAERLGIELILGSGPGWTGSGGPWVKPEQSMQHLVASTVEVRGPGKFDRELPLPPPRRPFFGDVPGKMRSEWEQFYRDVAVLAFPTPKAPAILPDIDEKALVYRAPFSSQPNVKPRLETLAGYPADPPGSVIEGRRILDLTRRLRPDGRLDWEIPEGQWTVMRFVSRNNGASTRPAPEPGIGFECDKLDAAALDAHFGEYVGRLLKRTGPRQTGRGWTMLHIDSWEMGAQNWTPRLREEFRKRRGYDPQPFYPVYIGNIVGSRQESERFLWDLRLTCQELVIENHAEHLRRLGRRHGFTLSIEPYDMNPVNDFDLGAVADVPMCEFWSVGFETSFSCQEAASIAHVFGRPIVAAEAFTGAPGEDWKLFPGALKNQGDWAFATGINRLTYHTFAHKPDTGRPGMVMGPYGVHWDRGQTWWPMVGAYHKYIARCQYLLRQGRTVADVLYLIPEGAPTVFQPPSSAFAGTARMPDRRGYNFDGCSAEALIKWAKVRKGQIVFPSGAAYRLIVLPNVDTMTPELLSKVVSLAKAGATIVGNPPRRSPSLVNFPACDREVTRLARLAWGEPRPAGGYQSRSYGKGRFIPGEAVRPPDAGQSRLILAAQWIWEAQGNPAQSAPVGKVTFRRAFSVPGQVPVSARLEMTADNSFVATLNGMPILDGDNFHQVYEANAMGSLRSGTNVLVVEVANAGDAPNPAGLIGALTVRFADGSQQLTATDGQWSAASDGAGDPWKPSLVLGAAKMGPWKLQPKLSVEALYPAYDFTSALLQSMGIAEDFSTPGPVRYTHRRTGDREIYFVANRSGQSLQTSATFRVPAGSPELWHPLQGDIRLLPAYSCSGGLTTVPLRIEPFESYFIVFPTRKSPNFADDLGRMRANFRDFVELGRLDGPWDVTFDPAMGAPASVKFEKLEDWTQRDEQGLRHYSGIATYRSRFDLPDAPEPGGAPVYLDLGAVHIMAQVRVNGVDCGVAWTAPWRVDITNAVKDRGNTLEIEVANLWPNRMIGDAGSPDRKFTQTTYHPYKAGDSLLPSGLLGPVRVVTAVNGMAAVTE